MTDLTPEQKIDEILNTAISHAITDGQNQIHDLKDGKATPEEISTRMEVSYKYHTKMTKAKLLALKSKWEAEAYKKGYIQSGIDNLTNGDK